MATWDLISERLYQSIRSNTERRIGIEIERIGMWLDGSALHYASGQSYSHEPRPGAEALLTELHARHDWEAVMSPEGRPLGFHSPFGKVSLEPGSQLELSADPVRGISDIVRQVEEFERLVDEIGRPWGLRWIGLGVNPLSEVETIDVIASPRYRIMTDYLGARASLGTSMMRLTSSIQLNLDYTSEKEAIQMLRVALAATPVSYALFGNSPIAGGKPTGFLSYRAEIWRHTDPDRTGLMEEVFEPDFDFRRYAELAWNRPLMFAQAADGSYVPAHGKSLAEIAAGGLPGAAADARNATNSIQEIFTEARLKPGYIEVRSIDGLGKPYRYAAAAFWLGLLYSADARELALDRLGKLPASTRAALWAAASKDGLDAKATRVAMLPIVRELVTASRQTLRSRGLGEEAFLAPIEESLETRANPGRILLDRFTGEWKGSIPQVIEYCTI